MSKKKDKPLYDEFGRWAEEHYRIKGAIRRTFRLSPQMKETLQSARVELPPITKKDGTIGKRPQVRYRCAICKELFPQKYVQVDHINPAIPLWKKEIEMTYDELVRGIICDNFNLQVVCSTPMKDNNGLSSCHKKKTDEENWIRKKINGQTLATNEMGWIYIIETLKEEYKKYLQEKELVKNERKKRKNKK